MYQPVPLCDISQVVRTGTYFNIVQVGTGRYVPVRTDMYQVYRIPDVCYLLSSYIEDLTSMSEPVSFTQIICCNCHETDPARITTTFFSTRQAVELHVARSKVCKAAGKGVRSVPVVYRESRRADDHEAGPIGAPGPWPVRRAGDGGAAGEISSPISDDRKNCNDIGNTRYRYIAILHTHRV